ncbi:recombinase family protein [Clostridium perfringens]|uniref:recombinase family protein n=1 Tax=Clostridium perfringens TaxID=1502 RepID=UPI002A353184|nr:recombinase family protein [Clostridium perfringens]MDM0995645.1 recombinase family protein [Clostridium perfringens]MDZ5043894.1 recombinase family protein [Clostridium perfringens]
MNVAYLRVSTIDQNPERQIRLMEENNVEKIFLDKCSGKNKERPELKAMLDFIREGDTLYIESFSRLARSTKGLLELVSEITEKKKVNLVSFKENIDTKTPAGKLMLTVIAAIYEFERECLLERQREGIAIAKELKKFKGRKKIDFLEQWEDIYKKYMSRELKANEAMEILGLKRTTFYKLKKEYRDKE